MSEALPEEYYVFPNGPLVVPSTEPTVHNASGFCADPTCPCQEDQELIKALHQQYLNGEVSADALKRVYHGGW
jgi:hypothetical protein